MADGPPAGRPTATGTGPAAPARRPRGLAPSAAAPGSSPVGGGRLLAPVAAICLFWVSLYLYVPVLAPTAHRLGAGVAGVGLVLGAYGFVQFLLRIPTGLWSDRLGTRAPFLVAALLACAAAAVGMGLATGPLALGLFRAVSGLAACGWVAITLLFAEFFPVERTAWAFGLVGFLATGSQLAASLAGGLLAQLGGPRAPFLAAAGAAALGVLVILAARVPLTADRRGRARGPDLRTRLGVVRERGVVLASSLSICSHYVAFVTTFGFTPLLAVDRFGASGLQLGVLTVCAGVPSAGAALLGGRLAATWPARRSVAAGFTLAAVAAGLVVAAPTLIALDAVAALGGLGLGLLGPSLMTTAVQGVPAERRGSAMGFYQSIYAIGMFGGPALAGWLGSRLGMAGLFDSTAAVAVLGAVGAWRWLASTVPAARGVAGMAGGAERRPALGPAGRP